MERIVVAGTASQTLAKRLADELDCPLADTDIRRFPDLEVYARIKSDVEGKHVILVQTTAPNENLIELLLLQDAAQGHHAAKVTSVIPYYGYARQDQVFHPGEAVSSRAVARALATTADSVITIDPHKEHILDFFFDGAHSVSAVPQLAEELGRWGVDAILAPDKGARDRAQRAAQQLGVPFDHLEKTRLSATEVVMKAKDMDVAGKKVAIVDDMIASGGTMIKAAAQLKEQGATAVFAACTHGIFTGDAVPKLLAGGIDRVLCTDTVEAQGCDVVSAAKAVASVLNKS
ncbi:MAG: ribose-phosphate diphosphokinase [Thermoplasmatota archaeon]